MCLVFRRLMEKKKGTAHNPSRCHNNNNGSDFKRRYFGSHIEQMQHIADCWSLGFKFLEKIFVWSPQFVPIFLDEVKMLL